MKLVTLFVFALLSLTPGAFADDNPILKEAWKRIKSIAKKTPQTNIYLKYHEAHYKLFQKVLSKVEDADKMGKSLNELEKNFIAFNATTLELLSASRELSYDPLKVMGKRLVGNSSDLDYVREYNRTANNIRRSLTEAKKTIGQMRVDHYNLVKKINAQKDFTRKHLIEELTDLDRRMLERHEPAFVEKLEQLQKSILSEIQETDYKIRYSADILN